MAAKIVIKNNGKIVREKTIPNKMHFEAQLKNPHRVEESKKIKNKKRCKLKSDLRKDIENI